MRLKTALMDAAKMRRTIIRIAHEIAVDSSGVSRVVLAGINARGFSLAKEIAVVVQAERGSKVSVERIDFTDEGTDARSVKSIGCLSSGAYVVTVNDVLRSGRTAFAVNEAIIGAGLPEKISHAALIDCGNESSLIRARYVGMKVDVEESDIVSVSVKEVDGFERVDIYSVDY